MPYNLNNIFEELADKLLEYHSKEIHLTDRQGYRPVMPPIGEEPRLYPSTCPTCGLIERARRHAEEAWRLSA